MALAHRAGGVKNLIFSSSAAAYGEVAAHPVSESGYIGTNDFVDFTLGILSLLWPTFVICRPRVYLGFHYPSDFIGGAALGILIVAIGVHLATRFFVLAVSTGSRLRNCSTPATFLVTFELGPLFSDVRHLGGETLLLIRLVVMTDATPEPEV